MKAFLYLCLLCAFVGNISFSVSAQTTAPPVTASPVTVSPLGATGKDERYRIGFQDSLAIQVFRHPDLNQNVSVNPNGTITLFRLPNVPIVAVCKTERELASDIADAYRKDYLRNPEVAVLVTEQRSRAFAVMGAVEKPAQYMISRQVRLLELLALAGGPSKEAGTRVLVARTGSTSNCRLNESVSPSDTIEVLDFRLSDILEAKANLMMRPGDIVSVLDADLVYVYGNVNKPGRYEIKEPITLTQAIASAEGLKTASDKGKIRVLRQTLGSAERQEIVYNLDDITSRKIADPFLEPNDVVAVNVDKMKEIFNSIGRSLTQGIPGLFYKVP